MLTLETWRPPNPIRVKMLTLRLGDRQLNMCQNANCQSILTFGVHPARQVSKCSPLKLGDRPTRYESKCSPLRLGDRQLNMCQNANCQSILTFGVHPARQVSKCSPLRLGDHPTRYESKCSPLRLGDRQLNMCQNANCQSILTFGVHPA